MRDVTSRIFIGKGGATTVYYLKDIMSCSNVDMPKVSIGTVVSFVRLLANNSLHFCFYFG